MAQNAPRVAATEWRSLCEHGWAGGHHLWARECGTAQCMISVPSPHSQSDWQTSIHAERDGETDKREDVAGPKEVISKQKELHALLEATQRNPGSLNSTHKHSTTISVLLLSALSSPFLSPPPSSANPEVINRPRLLSQPDVSAAGLIGWPFKTA